MPFQMRIKGLQKICSDCTRKRRHRQSEKIQRVKVGESQAKKKRTKNEKTDREIMEEIRKR